MKKKLIVTMCAGACMLSLGACGNVQEESVAKVENVEEVSQVVTIENFNHSVEIEEKPENVVLLTLNSAEMLAALGEAESIVGISRNNNTVDDVLPEYYDMLKDKAFPDEINAGIPTLEGMLSLQPDLVVSNSYYFNVPVFGTYEDYQTNEIDFYVTEGSYEANCTIENTYHDIQNLGAIFGKEEDAQQMIENMQKRINAVVEKTEGLEAKRVMSFDSVNEDKIYVAGGVGLANNLIELAGGENVFADLESQFSPVTMEEIISRNPEVIVIHEYTNQVENDAQTKIDFFKNTEELSEIEAVKNDCFVVVPLFAINPSLQNPDVVEQLAQKMYPEVFGN